MRKTEIEFLLGMLDEGYQEQAWHGPNLRGSLRGVTPQQAAWRPGPDRHNIWELTVHAAYWKYAVRRRLMEEKRGSFSEPGSNWFQRPSAPSPAGWKADRALLEVQHRRLREAVASFDPGRLQEKVKKWTLAENIRGAAFHDVYHAGQIQLLKRMQKKAKP